MEELDQFILPYLISNILAIIFLLIAWKNTRSARFLLALLFLYASVYNMFIGDATSACQKLCSIKGSTAESLINLQKEVKIFYSDRSLKIYI